MSAAACDADSDARDSDVRVDELEIRLAFLDDTVNSLNQVVAQQDRQILEFQAMLLRLQSDIHALRGALSADPSDEPPPPHY